MLDVPTGGGKTLAFWFALFYYWQPGCTDEASNKIVLVIGPLVALLEAQAQLLNSKGIPAIAVTSNTPDLEQALTTKKLGQNQYRVGFLGPEMGLTPLFHEKVLNSIPFTKNIINLIIDEVHCISEWGTDDFRPEYRKIVELVARLPPGTPITGATATAPDEVMRHLGCPGTSRDTAKVQHSNFITDMFMKIGRSTSKRQIASGEAAPVSATDALGLHRARVILWMKPRTFLSTVQKIGRCARDFTKRGEAVLYITKNMRTRCYAESESLREDVETGNEGSEGSEDEGEEVGHDRELALEEMDQQEGENTEERVDRPSFQQRVSKKKKQSEIQLRDERFLLKFIVTEACRRRVWDRFFGNESKATLAHSCPPGPCCDNCDPDTFELETVVLVGGRGRKAGRKGASSEELDAAIRAKLEAFREELVDELYPHQHFLSGSILLSDAVVDDLAKRARLIVNSEAIGQHTHWVLAPKYGDRVVSVIQNIVTLYPDAAALARKTQEAEREQRTMERNAFKNLRKQLELVFQGCYEAVYSEMVEPPALPVSNRKRKKPNPRRRCQLFIQLPKKNRYPSYYVQIQNPISMSNIKKLCEKVTHYTNIMDYRNDWHRMFDNATAFNLPDSEIYNDALFICVVFLTVRYSASPTSIEYPVMNTSWVSPLSFNF
ncbi:p-loop containing nucleoside triphosphate hydrolase protein [Mycena indigotica]|uniref:DNA 3'-5' helicase n=1 Tax=Mycena indigotica TaxID=2126181 RepID=A0A8H6SMP7_9AGAR|nr:p-loop containing nucleoside triphosphate hydrolase protein [Mycena indigotica]KAF7302211.1 p-loop containing nucleoside triphosphate hydrolase protein [Mycena indigotica]